MNSLPEIVREYEKAYRDLVTSKNLGTNQNVKDALRLNKEQDWSFICTALDVIGDTTLAIKNFLEFGLEGATGGSNDGEKYLRLYGVLNSTYLQQEAMYSLFKFNNLNDPEKVREKIKNLKIVEIRNKIGAHSSDYRANKGEPSSPEKIESYVPIRNSLVGHKFEYVNNEKSTEYNSVELVECLKEHLILIIDLLDKTYEKSIKTLYKGHQKKEKQLMDQLSELRKLKSNNPNNI